GAAIVAEPVLNPWRYFRIDGARHQPGALQLAQLVGEHALGNPRQHAPQLVETQHVRFQQAVEDHALPLAADQLEGGLHRATGGAVEACVGSAGHGGTFFDTMCTACAYFHGDRISAKLRSPPERLEHAMKAIGTTRPLPASDPRSLVDLELPDPEYGEHDLLVEVRAISVNPVDVKVRASAQPEAGSHRILGWDAVGQVRAVGSRVEGFQPGDRVYYAGQIDRPGSNAQLQAVDARIAAHAPRTLGDEDAAALPLTSLTGWETLFDRLRVDDPVPGSSHALLVIGGAGGVG